MNSTAKESAWIWFFVAWALSLISVLGTLFFSEVMKFPPCSLCWYQRIAMYPLFGIFTIALIYRDAAAPRYAWPFVTLGLLLALYHNLLYFHVIPESLAPCTEVSCTSHQIEWLGFITIPVLSFAAFATIGGCLLGFRYQMNRGSDES